MSSTFHNSMPNGLTHLFAFTGALVAVVINSNIGITGKSVYVTFHVFCLKALNGYRQSLVKKRSITRYVQVIRVVL